MSWYNRAMLAGKGYFDLEITSLEKVNEGRYLIKVRSRGFYYWRAEIAVAGLTTDNKPFATTFRMGKGDTRVEIELNVEGDIMMVTLDPHELIPELKRTNNTYKVE
ncbi:MAG: hypothetical protein U5N86_12530 [Planctomycetota bacterium]|nr:hypothetical protein [Planctomycetota bacterium]